MATRLPSDATVALRSLGRRYRAAFDSLDDDAADEIAHRNGPDGHSALDHVVAASRTLAFLGRALELVFIDDEPVLHPAVLDRASREWPEATGEVVDCVAELAWEADAVAERAERATAHDWSRRGRVAGHDQTTSASELIWDAVDSAVAHLKSVEETLAQVR